MTQECKTSEFNINEYYCYYYFINTIIIDIFKKRYTITKNIISDYLTKTNQIFNELFRKIIKDEIPLNPELSNHLINTFNTNSNLSLNDYINQINSNEFQFEIPIFNQIEKNQIFFDSSNIENINFNDLGIINHIINNIDESLINNIDSNSNNELDFDNDGVIAPVSDINNNNNNINENLNLKKRRLYVLKTNNEIDKMEIINFLENTSLRIKDAFYVKEFDNNNNYNYYFYCSFINPINFPFKKKTYLLYEEPEFANNNTKKIVISKGNYYEIKYRKYI